MTAPGTTQDPGTPDAGDGAYPEDWREQGWCCRECGAMSWYAMSLEVRREFLASMAAAK